MSDDERRQDDRREKDRPSIPAKHSTSEEDEGKEADPDDRVDETSRDSFPTSDPPAW